MAHLGHYDLDAFAPAVALLAIHSAISFADTLFVSAKCREIWNLGAKAIENDGDGPITMNHVQRLEHRGREAVAECLIRDLMVPHIYFDVEWPDSQLHVDVLAIDRAGSGDVHVVEIKKPVFNLPK